MILLLDAGNSRIKWRLQAGGNIQAQGALPTSAWAELPRHWLGRQAEVALVCSVAGQGVDAGLGQAVRTVLQGRDTLHWLVSPAQGHSIRNQYDPPASLGPDRFAALVAAHSLRPVDWLVVSVGTALIVDMLSAAGVFLGGAIAPGPILMADALKRGTAGLQEVAAGVAAGVAGQTVLHSVAQPNARAEEGLSALTEWPRNTHSAVAQGIAHALWGVVAGMFRRMSLAQGQAPAVLLSGGARGLLRPLLPLLLAPEVMEVEDLVLEGLACIARDLGYDA